ncbi:UDP-glucose:glycoprotein glucosyltransferase 2 [Lambiella insularis]|nr:UDP-glucose:glycoprotein glucosyltransferase 2 [Lambiella insularis]
MRLWSLPWEVVGVLFATTCFNARSVATSSVNVGLEASFSSPPFLLELLETAALENATSYFSILDKIAEGWFADYTNDREIYSAFVRLLQEDGHLPSPDALSSFQLALSIHAAAPRIEAHYQYYNTSVESSLMVAQDAACPVWVHFDGKQYCSPTLERAQQDFKGSGRQEELPFDHTLSLSPELPVSVLYADIDSPLFGHFHQTLSGTARTGSTSYRIRYRPSISTASRPLVVSGYGVELALKRTDYIVIDDRDKEKNQGDGNEKTSDSANIGGLSLETEELADLQPLSASELLGLGLKAGSFVMASDDPFSTLLKVSQDFPKHSSAIAKLNISAEFVSEHAANRGIFLPAGYNMIWMNGMQVEARQMDAFALLEQMRRERQLIGSLTDTGITAAEANSLISHSTIAQSKALGESRRYDYRDEIEGGKVIIWLNDIEKDKRYQDWPNHVSALLQRTFPGQLPNIRRDVHNLVMPIDLADAKDVETLVENLQTFVKRSVPVRFGVVPIVKSAGSIKQAKVVYYLLETYGLGTVFEYLESCIRGGRRPYFHDLVFWDIIKERKLRENKSTLDLPTIFKGEESEARARASQKYLQRLGVDGNSPVIFVNGVALPRNDAWLQTMSSRVGLDLQTIQRQVLEGTLLEDTWLAGVFLQGASTHRNALIIPEDGSSIKILDVGKLVKDFSHIYSKLPRIAANSDALKQFWSHVIVVADLDSIEGARILFGALEFRKQQTEAEIIIIHNPSSDTTYNYRSAMLFEQLVDGNPMNLESVEDAMTLDKITRHIETGNMTTATPGEMTMSHQTIMKETTKRDKARTRTCYENPDTGATECSQYKSPGSGINPNETHQMAEEFWVSLQPFARSLGLQPGENGVVLNGRHVGPVPKSAIFVADDFTQLLEYERCKRISPANTALVALGLDDRLHAPLEAAKVSSLIALSTISDVPEGIYEAGSSLRINTFEQWKNAHTAISTGDLESALIRITASIDPTSEVAQRWIPILKVLSEMNGIYINVYLNPRERMEELPIKRFYRHVLDSEPLFIGDGTLRPARATFDGLPKEALLNLAMDVPPAWLVAPKNSIHDLDNIKLSAIKDNSDIDATYELEHILIEGHSRDVTIGTAPRGVQLLLGTEKDPHFADTLIMANLGYFQFKANPGYWKIGLQSGASQRIYNIDSVGAEGYAPKPGDETTEIALMSFQGKTLFPRLSRKSGRENEDVLGETSTAGSAMDLVSKASKLASSLLSSFGLKPKNQHADINIFSVASGHLYERMLNIMMVSVMRHTKHSVKFWFIEQFLSPSFKTSLPHVAAAYNFEYEMVTYKWPHWLRAQKEKQREIWGYKILFLDVLFPLSLDKVIFVDADQIVRTDMYELVTHDLHGAPYGFTPMCDSRTEMEGFRFWKQGYWKNFLRGLPYHISALYVVDLKKFRQIAAGDRLRQQYHQLSADPNSLSNLDQDLPNHMQMSLPIHSLPQEWLWCETWCSDESLKQARTIDLCNNPQTKEPKLERARRQVPEWTVYDDEIAEVLRKARQREEVVAGAEERYAGVQEELDKAAWKAGKETKDEL